MLIDTYSRSELIADCFVHIVAIVVGLIAFAVLISRVAGPGDLSDPLAMGVYAAAFFLLFGFSLAYNMTPPSHLKRTLRYTALLSQLPNGMLAWTLAAIVWIVSLGGAAVKILLPGRLDRASVVVYLALGWVAIFVVKQLIAVLPTSTMILIVVGGLFYSVGVLFYHWKSLKYQNAIWHGFVAIAAACQFAGIAQAIGHSALGNW